MTLNRGIHSLNPLDPLAEPAMILARASLRPLRSAAKRSLAVDAAQLEDTAALFKKIDPHGAKPMGVTGRKWRVRPWAT